MPSPWLLLGAGILLVVIAYEQSPRLGGLLLIVIVLAFLVSNQRLLGGMLS